MINFECKKLGQWFSRNGHIFLLYYNFDILCANKHGKPVPIEKPCSNYNKPTLVLYILHTTLMINFECKTLGQYFSRNGHISLLYYNSDILCANKNNKHVPIEKPCSNYCITTVLWYSTYFILL